MLKNFTSVCLFFFFFPLVIVASGELCCLLWLIPFKLYFSSLIISLIGSRLCLIFLGESSFSAVIYGYWSALNHIFVIF